MGRKKQQSKHLIDLRPAKKPQSKFDGNAEMIDGLQHRYIRPKKISFFANIKYHLTRNRYKGGDDKWPQDWSDVGDQDN